MKLKINEPWITSKVRCQNGYVYIDKPFWNAENSALTINASTSASMMEKHLLQTKPFTISKLSMSRALQHLGPGRFLLISASASSMDPHIF